MNTVQALLEQKRLTAYYLWEARGRAHGGDWADWYTAEELIRDPCATGSTLRSSDYSVISTEKITARLSISHAGIDQFFAAINLWFEMRIDSLTLFQFDRNCKLHFDEGFLCTCHRIFKDESIKKIAPDHHYRHQDLPGLRRGDADHWLH